MKVQGRQTQENLQEITLALMKLQHRPCGYDDFLQIFLRLVSLIAKVDPIVHWYGLLILNPYKPMLTPLQTTFKIGAHSSEPVKQGKGPH